MKFWDSSAVIPLIVSDAGTPRLEKLLAADAAMWVWWASRVECVSALARLERERSLPSAHMILALRKLDRLSASWREILPEPSLRRRAERLLRLHALRAADALQLAAALAACRDDPAQLAFVCADRRLSEAASREGFQVLP